MFTDSNVMEKSKQAMWQIVSSGLPMDHDLEVLGKVVLYNLGLIITLFISSCLGTIALFHQNIVLGVTDFVIFIFVLWLFLYLRKTRNLWLVARIGVIGMFLLFSFLNTIGGINKTAYVWSFIYPLIAIFLLGNRLGSVFSLLFLGTACTLFILGAKVSFFTSYDTSLIIRFAACYFAISVFAFFMEWIREKVHKRMKTSNIELEKTVQELEKAKKDLAEALQASEKLRDKAQAASRAKSEFLANMSHELRTPLNAILGFSQIITRSQNLIAEDKTNLQIINSSGEHLLSLINDVLDMAKIESGRITLNKSSFDLHRMLDDVRDICKMRFEKKKLYLRFEKQPDVPQFVKTDETRLRQVLVNLLNNAVKFTDEGGATVRVKCSNISGNTNDVIDVQFEVEDTGAGIDPENIDRIFNPFVQDKAGVTSGKGAGLGLPISRKIAQMMNGNITVDSKLGHGSFFKVDIQLNKQTIDDVRSLQTAQRAIGIQPDESGHVKQYRILIVDDIESNRQVLYKLLFPMGFTIREATNGREAIDAWKEWYAQGHPPDLIWMDIRMPIMDGYEATKEIKRMVKEKGHNTIIIAVSASAFAQDVEVIFSAGCDDFVSKPFKESVILEKLGQHLGLDYTYEDTNSKVVSDSLHEDEDLFTEIKNLPYEWKNAMMEAVELSDHEKMCSLITEMHDQHTPLADVIQKKIDDFNYDEILNTLQNE